MLFLNNAFTKDITEYDGEVLKEVKTVDGKIYLSNGAIIKEGVVGKFFDIATNDKYAVCRKSQAEMLGFFIDMWYNKYGDERC